MKFTFQKIISGLALATLIALVTQTSSLAESAQKHQGIEGEPEDAEKVEFRRSASLTSGVFHEFGIHRPVLRADRDPSPGWPP